MAEIYFEKDGSVKGPYPADQLKVLAKQGVISPETVIWKNGSDKKFIASNIRGLFQPEHTEDFLGIGINKSNETPQIADFGAQSVSAVRDQASQFVQDLKEVDFKDEVFPIDQTLIKKMIEDSVFWLITALAHHFFLQASSGFRFYYFCTVFYRNHIWVWQKVIHQRFHF